MFAVEVRSSAALLSSIVTIQVLNSCRRWCRNWRGGSWYTSSCGVGLVGTGNPLTVSPTSTTTYYGRYEDPAPCSDASTCQSVTVTVNTRATAPTSASASVNPTCGGATALSASGGSAGTGGTLKWYSGSCGGTAVGPGNNLSVSPSATTIYYARYETAAPCSDATASASVTVTVNTRATAPTSASASVNPTCGGATTLSASGGSAGTGGTLKWYSGSCGGTAAGTGNNLSVSPSATTTYYGRYETAAPCSDVTACASVTVTVDAKSADPTSATASVNPICTGGSTVLTLSGGGGGASETIKWYTGSCGGTLAGTGNSLNVSPTTTTTYYGRYEDGAPCSYNSACVSVTVTVNPLPTAGVNSATICVGGSATLTATSDASSPGYLWSPGAETTASIMVSPTSTTTYTVTVTDGTTSCANSGSGTVTVNPLPTVSVNSETISPGGSATLTATTGASSPGYLWSPGAATTASITVSPTSTTTYTVTVTDGTTSCANSGSGIVTVSAPSLASVTISNIIGTTLTYGGGSGSEFVLLKSASVVAPLSGWDRLLTNTATPGTFTIPAVGTGAPVFYDIKSE